MGSKMISHHRTVEAWKEDWGTEVPVGDSIAIMLIQENVQGRKPMEAKVGGGQKYFLPSYPWEGEQNCRG